MAVRLLKITQAKPARYNVDAHSDSADLDSDNVGRKSRLRICRATQYMLDVWSQWWIGYWRLMRSSR